MAHRVVSLRCQDSAAGGGITDYTAQPLHVYEFTGLSFGRTNTVSLGATSDMADATRNGTGAEPAAAVH